MISRAPVRYNLPPAPSDIPGSEAELERALAAEPEKDDHPDEDEPRSRRPGQKGFAERLMSKYVWSRGTGLGADGSGIINPLRVQIEKRKKKSDAEGGGFRDAGGRGKIIGGKKNVPEKEEETGKFGPMSEVIVLRGMVDGMNLDEEVEGSGDGGLMQEIGDECAEKVPILPDCSSQERRLTCILVWPCGTGLYRPEWRSSEGIRQVHKPVVCLEGKLILTCDWKLLTTEGRQRSRRPNIQWERHCCLVLRYGDV